MPPCSGDCVSTWCRAVRLTWWVVACAVSADCGGSDSIEILATPGCEPLGPNALCWCSPAAAASLPSATWSPSCGLSLSRPKEPRSLSWKRRSGFGFGGGAGSMASA